MEGVAVAALHLCAQAHNKRLASMNVKPFFVGSARVCG